MSEFAGVVYDVVESSGRPPDWALIDVLVKAFDERYRLISPRNDAEAEIVVATERDGAPREIVARSTLCTLRRGIERYLWIDERTYDRFFISDDSFDVKARPEYLWT